MKFIFSFRRAVVSGRKNGMMNKHCWNGPNRTLKLLADIRSNSARTSRMVEALPTTAVLRALETGPPSRWRVKRAKEVAF